MLKFCVIMILIMSNGVRHVFQSYWISLIFDTSEKQERKKAKVVGLFEGAGGGTFSNAFVVISMDIT